MGFFSIRYDLYRDTSDTLYETKKESPSMRQSLYTTDCLLNCEKSYILGLSFSQPYPSLLDTF